MSGPTPFQRMTRHGAIVHTSHDEMALENFAQAMHSEVFGHLMPGNKDVYESRVLPAFKKREGRKPTTRKEVRAEMREDPYHQTWSALRRTTQEMMWIATDTCLHRTYDDLHERAQPHGQRLGSLDLDSNLDLPRYVTALDIHCMPGGYCGEATDGDVYAGALYDRGVYSITQGFLGPKVDGFGRSSTAYIKRNYPAFRRGKILDVGCAVGHGSVAIAETMPEAEVHAIDVAAPMLRYAHARAESLGVPVHFSQQNAEHMTYDDNTFDFVVSGATLHELSTAGIKNIIRECYRVLKPGGVMVHIEQPQYEGMDPYDQFMRDWDTFGNNEPFWGTLHDLDLKQLAVAAGFANDKVRQSMEWGDEERGRVYNVEKPGEKPTPPWFFYTATK
ncbi:MAG: class I SAM-dependent methyltransferase [Alphaproteobacteria bacterium]|nr:class I SAM-dependent methyltransferase [Alphaproteobacteria bacterium]